MSVAETAGEAQLRLAYDRTQLANERTLAAWIRTGLSVAAVGLAAIHFIHGEAGPADGAVVLGTALVVAGAAIIVFGGRRFVVVARSVGGGASESAPLRPAAAALFAGLLAALLLALLVFA